MTGATVGPLVSVVIPVFNGADYLAQAIDSALGQTYPAIEVLVVDDGSTDDGATARVAARYEGRIRYFHQANGGVAAALNRGIAEMRGELFSWLSHDDLYLPRKVERQVAAWRAFGGDCVVVGDFATATTDGAPLRTVAASTTDLLARPLDALIDGTLNGCAMLVPRAVFDRIGRFDPGLPTTQDYHLWFRMAHRVPFVHVPSVDVLHRLHPGQGSRQPEHLDEAGQLYVHVLAAVPPRRMAAYAGSEPAFLARCRGRLQAYPGVAAHIDRRLNALCDEADLTLVLLDSGTDAAAAMRTVRGWRPRPRRVLRIDCGGGPLRRPTAGLVAVAEPARDGAEALALAGRAAGGEWIFFAAPARLPDIETVRTALLTQAAGDADIVPAGPAGDAASPLENLLVRRGVAGRLAATLAAGATLDPERLAAAGIVVARPLAAAVRPDLERALAGDDLVPFEGMGAEAGLLAALDARLGRERPRVLFLCHSGGGGTVVHLRGLTAALGRRIAPVIAYGGPDGRVRLSLTVAEDGRGVAFDVPRQHRALVRVLRRAGIRRVDIFHTHGFDAAAERLVADLDIPFDITLVDYHHVAHHPHLLTSQGRFCGDRRVAARDPLVLRSGPSALLVRAARAVAISRDVAHRTAAIAPGIPLVCAAHWARPPGDRRTVLPRPLDAASEPLRVLLVGTITPLKGRDVLAEAARIVRSGRLPIRFHVVGSVLPPPPLPDDVIAIRPAADLSRSQGAIAEIGAHLGWLPAQAPETWSYALTDLIAAGLPLAAGAIGAIPERCAGRPWTWLLPWDSTAGAWVDLFLRLHATALAEPPRWVPVDHLPPAEPFYPDRYLEPLAR
ncbi:glycosyltransferase [Stella sp.]|uniref:glycosyltransferase n=1 Tax=Stella sp. TaxID=2912054 RepID=UPI0035AE1790